MPSNLSDEDLRFLEKDKDLLVKNPANKEDATFQNEVDETTTDYIEHEEVNLPDDELPTFRETDFVRRN